MVIRDHLGTEKLIPISDVFNGAIPNLYLCHCYGVLYQLPRSRSLVIAGDNSQCPIEMWFDEKDFDKMKMPGLDALSLQINLRIVLLDVRVLVVS